MPHVVLPRIGTEQAWRTAARNFLALGIPPDQIIWGDTHKDPGLFDDACGLSAKGQVTVPRGFLDMAQRVVWHSDPERFARLYAFLWRLRETPHLMSDRGDADLARLRRMEKSVRRCQHKMKAFVRFRDIGAPGDQRRSFAAWFEPSHHTIEPTAQFFAKRFGDMDWRILTPDVSAFFENGCLRFDVDLPRPSLPDDANEGLWITYFRNIFNPARLKIQAMQSEMPKKYWKNIPEAAAIPDLIASAPKRAAEMAAAAPTLPATRTATVLAQQSRLASAWEGPADALPRAIQACTRCALHKCATQAVPGEGPFDAQLMIVGEQPGDQEDLSGRPFVGPAGQLFDEALAQAGLDRRQIYLTNAVKHFKFRAVGRKRIHQRPEAGEISHCRWWLDAEIAQIRPRIVLAMGATATVSLTESSKALGTRRGRVETGLRGVRVLPTWHPAYMLRGPGADQRARAMTEFVSDLAQAKRYAEGLAIPTAESDTISGDQ